MSCISVQVGQCGNQVGLAFLKSFLQNNEVKQSLTFKDNEDKLRSVHIDSEPKVVNRINNILLSNVRKENILFGKRGRGSNWALGYYGFLSEKGNSLVVEGREIIRKEVERCDNFSGIILMHSLSGGTGSGIGSRLSEVIRDDYPMNYLLSCTFAPFEFGETPVQNYNNLLALSKLQSNCDGIILTHNDEIMNRILKKKPDTRVSLSDINQLTTEYFCGVFAPTDTLRPKSGISIGNEPWELLRSTCPMPSTKFLHLNHLAEPNVAWEPLIGWSLQNLRKYNKQGEPFGCLSCVAIGRGERTDLFHEVMEKNVEKRIKSAYNCVTWNPFPVDTWSAKRVIIPNQDWRPSITIASNYSNVVEYLQKISKKSKQMFDSKAYLHWYYKYGATDDVFEEAFDTANQVIDGYQAALM